MNVTLLILTPLQATIRLITISGKKSGGEFKIGKMRQICNPLKTKDRLNKKDRLALHKISIMTSWLPKFKEGARGCVEFSKSSFELSF